MKSALLMVALMLASVLMVGSADADTWVTTGPAEQLTFNSSNDSEPSWSPNGDKIAFASDRTGVQQIYVVDLATGTDAPVTSNGNRNWHPDWSPDGQLISFTGGPSSDQIWVVASDGSGISFITSSGAHRHPDWSPDGSEFAFTAYIGNPGPIHRINSDGSGTPSTVVSSGWYADWSPDGNRIALARFAGSSQIFLVDPDGSNLKNISTSGDYHAYPAWSPDGSVLACSITKGGDSEIYIIDTLGNELLQVTESPTSSDIYPTWSPLGDAIAFHSNRSGNTDIWMVGIEGGGSEPGEPGYFIHITDLHVSAFANETITWGQFLDFVNTLYNPPAFVVATGDLVHHAWYYLGLVSFAKATPNWNALVEPLSEQSGQYYVDDEKQIPIYFAPGNHDEYSNASLIDPFKKVSNGFGAYEDYFVSTYRTHFNNHSKFRLFSANSGGDTVEYGGHCLPEGDGIDATVFAQFSTDLANYQNNLKIVLMHHPTWNTSGGHGERDGTFLHNHQEFIDTCLKYDVKAVLGGHVHGDAKKGPLKGVCNYEHGEWNTGDGTLFITTPALKDGYYREVHYSSTGSIDSVSKAKRFKEKKSKSSIFCCLTEVHVYDSDGNHLGPNNLGGIDFEIQGAYYEHSVAEDDVTAALSSATEVTLSNDQGVGYFIEAESLNDVPIHLEIIANDDDDSWSGIVFDNISVVDGSIIKYSIIDGMVDIPLLILDPDGSSRLLFYTDWLGNRPPLAPSTPVGPVVVFVGSSTAFETSTLDPDGDVISYLFDWGDGESDGWQGTFTSGESVTAPHSWSAPGIYSVKARARDEWHNLGYWSDELQVTVLPNFGDLSGLVTGPTGGLLGVPVDLVDSEGELYASTLTDDLGHYEILDVPNGVYSVSISTPLGYQTDAETKEVEIGGLAHEVNFALSLLDIVPQQRSRGYWAHQLHKALQNMPKDYTVDDFAEFAGLINVHFNHNQVNPVDFYSVPQPADQTDSLTVLKKLLHMSQTDDDEPFPRRLAKAQLMTLMLNVVSGKVNQTHEISADSRTVSQAITYCDMLVGDEIDPPDDEGPGHGSEWCRYIRATFILQKCNLGLMVPAGMIPENVIVIAYRLRNEEDLPDGFELSHNYPNPFNPSTNIEFTLPSETSVSLDIFNVLGQKITSLVNGRLPAGTHVLAWDGTGSDSRPVASGAYFYRLETPEYSESKKMLLSK